MATSGLPASLVHVEIRPKATSDPAISVGPYATSPEAGVGGGVEEVKCRSVDRNTGLVPGTNAGPRRKSGDGRAGMCRLGWSIGIAHVDPGRVDGEMHHGLRSEFLDEGNGCHDLGS